MTSAERKQIIAALEQALAVLKREEDRQPVSEEEAVRLISPLPPDLLKEWRQLNEVPPEKRCYVEDETDEEGGYSVFYGDGGYHGWYPMRSRAEAECRRLNGE